MFFLGCHGSVHHQYIFFFDIFQATVIKSLGDYVIKLLHFVAEYFL